MQTNILVASQKTTTTKNAAQNCAQTYTISFEKLIFSHCPQYFLCNISAQFTWVMIKKNFLLKMTVLQQKALQLTQARIAGSCKEVVMILPTSGCAFLESKQSTSCHCFYKKKLKRNRKCVCFSQVVQSCSLTCGWVIDPGSYGPSRPSRSACCCCSCLKK